jgi:hypothetical protein
MHKNVFGIPCIYLGSAVINARRTCLTNSEIVKTLATSGSRVTVSGDFMLRLAKLLGHALL